MKKLILTMTTTLLCWSHFVKADRAPVKPPNGEISPTKNQRSNDDVAAVLKSCIDSGAASSPEKSRTLKTAEPAGQVSEDQFLKSIHGRVLQNLKNLEGDQCSRFINEVASRSKALRELRACARVQLSLKHSAKPEASTAANPLHETQSLGFDVVCEKSSTKDALAVHQFGSRISKEEKEISMTENESVVWCNNFKKSVGGQLSALRKDIDRLQRQQAQGLAASSGNSKGDFYRRFSDLIESAEHTKRKECLQVADQLTQENPLLKHIKNHPATSAEILAATKKCTAETKEAQTQFAKMDLTKKGSDVQALALLDPVVAEEIKAHPESCASYLKVRNSLADEAKRRGLVDLAIAGGSVVGCTAAIFFATPVVGGACFAASGALSFTSSTVHASQALAHAATLKSGGVLGVDPGLARAADNEVTQARFSQGLALVGAVPGVQLVGRGAVAAREVSREAAREALLIANTEKTIAEASEQVSKGARAVLPDSARILPGRLLEDTLGVSNSGARAATTISEASAPLANVEAKLTLVGGKPVVIGSEVNPGTAGMAMLGELDGKPVVLYTRSMAGQFGPMGASARMVQMSNGQVQESAQGARILSEMGIGPKFHGVVELEEQIAGTTVKRAYSVVDPVPGDFPAKMGAAINKQTYKDLETVISRVSNRAGEITDLQYLVGKNGRISVIDPEPGILAGAGASNKSPDLLSQATRFRANLIDETTNQAVSTQYLRELRIQDRSAFESVVQSLRQSAARTDSAEQLIRANKLKKILSGL